MKKNMNKFVSKTIDAFLMREETGTIHEREYTGSDGTKWKTTEMDLFACLEQRKHVLGYLVGLGLDPFKRGTKEPEKIANALFDAKWEVVKFAPQFGRSMFD